LVYKFTLTHEDSQFSPQKVLAIQAFWIFVLCLWSDHSWVHVSFYGF